MRAIIINGYGGPDVLELADLSQPEPQPGETLIHIRAAAVNPADGKWRAGMFADFAPVGFPHVLGYDIAGEAAGGDGFPLGARVFGMLDPFRKGGYAEYAAAPAGQLAVIPKGLDFETAAAIPTAGLTGTQMVEAALDVQPGERILLTGAVGAVGRFALWAARRRGAHVVAAVRFAQQDAALAEGADEALTLDGEEWSGAPFDAVIDTVGGPGVARLCRHLKPGGRIVTAATTPIDPDGLAAAPELFVVRPSAADARRIAEAVAAGQIKVPVAKVMPLEQAAEAQVLTDRGGAGGKIILAP